MKQVRISVGSRSFTVIIDELTVQNSRHKRFRIVSSNQYFNAVFGDAAIIVVMTPAPSYYPKSMITVSRDKHDELLEAICQAITVEYVV